MADPFVAEIRIFPFNFAPTGWAFCDGQLLPLSQNTALFSLLGTTYGGDGKTNFALPEPAGQRADASGPGPRPVAARSRRDRRRGHGDACWRARSRRTLTASMRHVRTPTPRLPGSRVPRRRRRSGYLWFCRPSIRNWQLSMPFAPAGGSQPHNNLMPYLTLNFCIALQGVFPPRT